jgi:hypothetical protein
MFELNGKQYTLAQVEAAAAKSNKTLDEYVQGAGLITIEPGKTTPTGQGAPVEETAAPGKNTASGSEAGSSALINADDFEKTQEKDTLIERVFGKTQFTDAIGDIYRAGASGVVAGSGVDEAFDLYKLGSEMTDEQVMELVRRGRELEAVGQTDEMIEASQLMQKYKKEGMSGFGAWVAAYMENPTTLFQYSIQSLAQMATAAFDSDEVIGTAAASAGAGALTGAGTGAGIGALFGGVGAAPGAAIGAKFGAIGGFFGGLSGAMETSLTTAQLLQETAAKSGYDWQKMTDSQRADWIRNITNNKELFDDIKSRALSRGITIGAIDGLTGAISAGAGSKLATAALSKTAVSGFAGGVQTIGVAAAETTGGIASEYFGQKAAGQEFNLEEILIEGFADKTFTAYSVAKNLSTGNPSYKINGEKMNGKKFSETLKLMDDEAYVNAKIEIENSPAVQKLVDNRRKDIAADQSVDSRISNVDDRAEAIRLTKQKAALSKEGNKNKIAQIDTKLKAIEEKYANSEIDVTIEQRKQAIAQAVDNKFEQEFNKNYLAIKAGSKKIGIKSTVYKTDTGYKNAILKEFGKLPKGWDRSTGVFAGNGKVFINKAAAKRAIDISTGKIGEISVASHETLHPIFNALIGDATTQGTFVKGFKKLMTSNQRKYVDQQLKKRGYGPGKEAIELMNIFSDGIIKGEINYDQSAFSKLGSAITNFFRSSLGLATDEISFKDARGVFNFLKEYNTSISEGRLSETAIKAVQQAEIEQNVKVSEAQRLEQMQASRTFTDEQDSLLQEEVALYKKKLAENEELNKKFGKDVVSSQVQAAAGKLREKLNPLIQKIVANRTQALYDKIPAEQKKNVPRSDYELSLANNIFNLLNEYNGKQPLEKFLVDRSFLRANSLAKELGIEQQIKVSIDQTTDEGSPAMQITSDYTDATTMVEIRKAEAERVENLVDPVELLGEDIAQEYYAITAEKVEKGEFKGLTLATAEDAAPEITAKYFGMKLNAYLGVNKEGKPTSANFSGDKTKAQQLIYDNADLFITLLPEGAILESDAASKDLAGTGVRIPRKLQQAFYEKQSRLSKGAGLEPFKLKENITKKDFLDTFGINTDGTFQSLANGSPKAISMIAFARLIGRLMTNTAARAEMAKRVETGEYTFENIQDLKAGTSEIQFQLQEEALVDQNQTSVVDVQRIGEFANSTIDKLKDKAKKYGYDYGDEPILPTNKSQGNQKFFINRLKPFLDTQDELFLFMPPVAKLFKGLVNSIVGKNYREDSTGFDFLLSDIKTLVYDDGSPVLDVNAIEEIIDRNKPEYRDNKKFYTSEGNTANYSKYTLDQIAEVQSLLDKAKKEKKLVGRETSPNNAYTIYKAKQNFKPIVEDAIAIDNFKKLSKNNELNKAIAKLYISLMRDFVASHSNKKAAIKAVMIMLVANRNMVNSWRSLSSVARVIYDPNNITAYHFEHDKSMALVVQEIFELILNPDLPIEFNSTASLIPADVAILRDSKAETKISDEKTAKEVYKEAKKQNPNLKMVAFDDNNQIEILDQWSLQEDMSEMVGRTSDIDSKAEISEKKANVLGKTKGKWKFFIPPSADDLMGLMYYMVGKGKQGDQDLAWIKKNIADPFAKGIGAFTTYRQAVMKDFRNFKKALRKQNIKLNEVNSTGFTNEVAVRVYIWTKRGMELPEGDLTQAEIKELIKVVKDNQGLENFAKQVLNLTSFAEIPTIEKNWDKGSITTDILDYLNTSSREKFLEEYLGNVEEIFGTFGQDGKLKGPMANRLKAAYGENYIEALSDVLYRMKTGRARPAGANKLTNQFTNWINDSVGAIMFFNTRSALLQQLSFVNFINFSDNNPLKAAAAFVNQKQFWSDYAMLFNSDFLKERRSGLKTDVNADEIAKAAEEGRNPIRSVIASILKKGFLPTQIADSHAIALGGASFYRNRLNRYLSEGMPQEQAEQQAFLDFQEAAEESQQSSRPDRISQQQASPLGRIVLAFANTPMQYARLTKKAALDLINGRGDWKTNLSKLMYYGAVQNIIFSAMQTALFAMMFEDDDDEKEQDRYFRIANSSADGILRGVGFYGAIAATAKNMILEAINQANKARPNYERVAIKALTISPPVDSKIRKLMAAGRTFTYRNTREKMAKEGFSLDNPAFEAVGQIISATTNLPADRVIRKMDNLSTPIRQDVEMWQAISLALGYSKWDVGLIEAQTKKSKGKVISKTIKKKTIKK